MTDRSNDSRTRSSFVGLFLRTWWMFLGNAALVVVAALMALDRNELPSSQDAVFAALVASLAAARFTDIRRFGGLTADGARAGMDHFRRYLLRLMLGSAAVWGSANAVAAL
jgi:hypothetical protein